MSRIYLGPCGNLIKGHVLDSARSPLEAKMREYDSQLYVKWNPSKLRGEGLWEVRRRPENKVPKYSVVYKGNTYTSLEYVENGLVSHLFDVPYLNYKILEKLKEIDTWNASYKVQDYGKDLDYKEAKIQEKLEEKAEGERDYMIKQHKSQIKDFMEYVQSGGNPYAIADFWK